MTTSRELILAEQAKKINFDHAKNSAANAVAVDEYFRHWDGKNAEDETDEIRQARTADYASLTRQYYYLATDLYEYAWGASFHFSIARHKHYLAHNMRLKSDMTVLDVGCGVGGPAREMVKFIRCHAATEGLSHKLKFVQGDFMNILFPDNSFDAVYAIKATAHAPSLEGVYKEIFRVLKPGGVFGVYEWLMTEEFNNNDLEHRRIRLHIEEGGGIAQMFKISDGLAAISAAGFDLELHHDLAADDDGPAPWYWPLDSDLRYAQTLVVAHSLFSVLETVRVIPTGTRKTAESLGKAADALVEGGKKKLFTPMYLMVGRKPV
ncbi:S-adenosyl-L-methionine-dependent methyltransferase [Xylariaceae sp. FL0255]|nr:S-adenosyl-L-methionine-dependent methyltransferase [Xylariaceae sp. FL0255]